MTLTASLRRKKGMTFACGIAFVGAFAASATLFAARTASAKYNRVTASSCLVQGTGGWVSYTNFALSNGDASKSIDITCPVPDSDYLQHHKITTLNVHGMDNSAAGSGLGRVLTEACISFYGSNSGSCGGLTFSSSGGTGPYALQPPLSELQNELYAYDFAYVFVRLPANTGNTFAASNLRGIYISD
jgi:hypothetical protein